MKNKMYLKVIISLIIITAIALFLISRMTGNAVKSGESQKIQITPLSQQESDKVKKILTESDFIKDIPKNSIVSLRFYSFIQGKRVWKEGFLLGKGRLLESGTPEIYFIMDAKYISELNEKNLCEVVKKANNNGDLGVDSEMSKARILLKYAGMLRYRSCLGL